MKDIPDSKDDIQSDLHPTNRVASQSTLSLIHHTPLQQPKNLQSQIWSFLKKQCLTLPGSFCRYNGDSLHLYMKNKHEEILFYQTGHPLHINCFNHLSIKVNQCAGEDKQQIFGGGGKLYSKLGKFREKKKIGFTHLLTTLKGFQAKTMHNLENFRL